MIEFRNTFKHVNGFLFTLLSRNLTTAGLPVLSNILGNSTDNNEKNPNWAKNGISTSLGISLGLSIHIVNLAWIFY